MESKNIQRVVISKLADAKILMHVMSSRLEDQWEAYGMMLSFGISPNAAALDLARNDVAATLELTIAVGEEFNRLHVNCECPTTAEEVTAGLAMLREKLEEVREAARVAGPVNTDPAAAVADLRSFLGATGFPVPEGYDRQDGPQDLKGLNYGGDQPGTGLYL